MIRASIEFKQGENLVDINADFILTLKKEKFCVERLSKQSDKKKDKDITSKCMKSTNTEYIYPSDEGFWFIEKSAGKIIHLTSELASEINIPSQKSVVLEYRGITNNFALKVTGTTDLFVVNDGKITRADTIEKTCIADSNPLFSSTSNAKYWGLTCYRTGKQVGELEIVVKEILSGKIKQTVSATTINSDGPINNIWVSNSIGKNHPLLVSYSDGQYTQYSERGNKQWSNTPELEDAFEVLSTEFPSEAESDEIPVYESFGNNLVGAFMYRVASDCKNLVQFAMSLVTRVTNLDVQEIINKVTGKHGNQLENMNYYNKYGLRQNLIFITKTNKIVSVNSMNGNTLWSTTLQPGQSIIKAMVNVQHNIDVIYSEKGHTKRTEISSLDGKFISQDIAVDSKANVFLEGPDYQAPIEIGFENNYLKNTAQEFVFYRVDKEKGVMGYRRTTEGKFEETWNYQLETGQIIIDYSYHLKGNNEYLTRAAQGSPITLPEEEALYFKVVDSGNIALLISQKVNNKEVLSLAIINTVRGKILGTYFNDAVDFNYPIGFIYDDNGIYTSYFNSKLSSYELWSIELFKIKVETSFIEMLQKYVFKLKSDEELDYHKDQSQYIILDKKYGLSVGLKYLGAVSTRHGLTKRNLLGITTNSDVNLNLSQIVSLDRMLISARRNTAEAIEKGKTKKNHLSYYSSVYPPYQYFLPLAPLATLNAKWRLSGIEKIKIVETKFESTSLVVAYGKDVFVTKIQPDYTFDLLSEEFNYTLLGLACIGITVGLDLIQILVFVLRKMGGGSEAKKRYLAA